MDEQSSDIVEQMFGENPAYEVPVPGKKRDFLPWHKPRKQFVRDRQWAGEIDRLLTENPLPDGKSLTYLGLPGNDLLDLRHIHKRICVVKQCLLRFLGFNSGAKASKSDELEMNLSLAEVRSLERVDERSDIILDEFSLLSNQRSLAYARAKAVGPFDIINLDLCDGFGIHPAGAEYNTYYNSISALLSLQARQNRPWLLFLTTRVDRASVDERTLELLMAKYVSNVNESAEFAHKSAHLFGMADEESVATGVQSELGHLRVFLTGLSKWMISLALEGRPPTSVKVKSVMGYRVADRAQEVDLVSIAFRFDPVDQPMADPLGLARAPQSTLSEPELALSAIQKIAGIKDVDGLLSANVGLLDEATSEMASLVELARYDRDEFLAWARKHHPMEAIA